MTRKDYERIAMAIRSEVDKAREIDDVPVTNHDGLVRQGGLVDGMNQSARNIANNIASTLEDENPRFDRERFIQACGAR